MDTSCTRAKALQYAWVKEAILLAAISALAFLSAPCTVGLSAMSAAPAARLSTTRLSFGYVTVGTTSAAHTVTLTNISNAALSITSVAITGANASNFAQSNNCGSSVGPGRNCTINVTFTPTASGYRSASVSITDNAIGSPQRISLSGMATGSASNPPIPGTGASSAPSPPIPGTGAGSAPSPSTPATPTPPAVSLSLTSLTFASQPVGTTSAARTIALGNTGNGLLTVTGLAITGPNASDFAQTNSCGSSVAAGGNCTIGVTFTPAATGSRTASLSISDNGSGSPQMVALSGTGTATTGVSLSATTLSFGTQPVATTSAAQTLTLNNGGSVPLSISGLTITGANSGDFVEVADTCGSSLAGGGNCTIGVAFTPSATGQRTATLSITDNASGSPQTATLTGTGSPDVILSWGASPSSGIAGYNVYRGTTSGGESSTPLNSTPINGTSYVDTNVTSGMTYYYVVTSVGSNGAQSAPSNETEAFVPTS